MVRLLLRGDDGQQWRCHNSGDPDEPGRSLVCYQRIRLLHRRSQQRPHLQRLRQRRAAGGPLGHVPTVRTHGVSPIGGAVCFTRHTGLVTAIFDWLVDPSRPETGADRSLPPFAFRYMASDGLLATIESRKLRMNAWSRMNDPREAMVWRPTGIAAAGSYTEAEMNKRVDDVLRRSACLLAMTADREPTPGADPDSLFHRGWGRAPLWAHYADDHRGVCMLLHVAAVQAALDDLVPMKDGRYTSQGRIKCVDGPIQIGGLTGGPLPTKPPWMERSPNASTALAPYDGSPASI
jgi:hypothetical protein